MINSQTLRSSAGAFVLRSVVVHTVTYFVAGLVASQVFDYERIFGEPIVRDYMLPYEASGVGLGPWLQPLRGAIFGVVLLPFRGVLSTSRHGWLFLWGLFVGLGILGTPAAAPSSVEGVIYSRLPVWYHLLGLPEIALQTLAFSWLLHRSTLPKGERAVRGPAKNMLAALAGASFAFIGYAVVSIAFAFAVGDGFQSEGAMSLRVQGLFLAPLVLNALLVFGGQTGVWPLDRPVVVGLVAWGSNAAAIFAYQALVLGRASPAYALLAPMVPALITALVARRRG
jgi:hypothetical protein